MSHDFAKSRRPAPPTKKKKSSAVVPGWVSVLLGTLAGALVMYLVYVSGYAPPLPDMKTLQQAEPAPADTVVAPKPTAKEPPAPPKRTSPVFEFYTKLPASGAPTVDTAALPDGQPPALPAPTAATDLDPIQQLLAQQEAAKQQAAKQQAGLQQGLQNQTVATVPAPVAPSDATGVTVAAPDNSPEATPPKEKAVPPTKTTPEPAVKTGGRYALQAGAFRKRSDADTLRAKLLLLGVQASIQTGTSAKGEPIHRVIAGPFTSAEDMDDARIILGGNHITTIPVK